MAPMAPKMPKAGACSSKPFPRCPHNAKNTSFPDVFLSCPSPGEPPKFPNPYLILAPRAHPLPRTPSPREGPHGLECNSNRDKSRFPSSKMVQDGSKMGEAKACWSKLFPRCPQEAKTCVFPTFSAVFHPPALRQNRPNPYPILPCLNLSLTMPWVSLTLP